MRRGFTLLEVMVALAIAIPALLLLYRQGALALDMTGSALAYQDAISRAQSHMAALSAGGIVAGDRQGDDGGGYHWRIRSVPAASWTPQRGPGATLYDVHLEISWKGSRGPMVLALDSRMLGPAATQSP